MPVNRVANLPISAVVPTKDRAPVLARMLESLLAQGRLPAQLVFIDASADDSTKATVEQFAEQVRPLGVSVLWAPAEVVGAAVQRNQGVALTNQPVIAFVEDDILFEPACIERLWKALSSDAGLGGANAMITNQHYSAPGRVSSLLFWLLAGKRMPSYAGRVLGPAVNLLPDDDPCLPDVVPVEWMNLGCTLYRRDALSTPPFPSFFTGYSMMEDLTLSWTVGRQWKLANVRIARIFHDSQPGTYKSDPVALSRMELVNRHFVMTTILGRRRVSDYLKLAGWEVFQLLVTGVQRGPGAFLRVLRGKVLAVWAIARSTIHRQAA